MYSINIDENLGNLLDKENIDAEKGLQDIENYLKKIGSKK